jgi:hypothetical protein
MAFWGGRACAKAKFESCWAWCIFFDYFLCTSKESNAVGRQAPQAIKKEFIARIENKKAGNTRLFY